MKRRTSPVAIKRSRHDKMLDEMHNALYTLGNKVNPPILNKGSIKLLPPELTPEEYPKTTIAAKKHVESLHKMFKATPAKE